jgi:hypothetical protein
VHHAAVPGRSVYHARSLSGQIACAIVQLGADAHPRSRRRACSHPSCQSLQCKEPCYRGRCTPKACSNRKAWTRCQFNQQTHRRFAQYRTQRAAKPQLRAATRHSQAHLPSLAASTMDANHWRLYRGCSTLSNILTRSVHALEEALQAPDSKTQVREVLDSLLYVGIAVARKLVPHLENYAEGVADGTLYPAPGHASQRGAPALAVCPVSRNAFSLSACRSFVNVGGAEESSRGGVDNDMCRDASWKKCCDSMP